MSDAIGVVNKAGLALLKSNAEKGIECSAGETLKLIEALEIGHKHIFELHDSLALIKVLAKQAQEEVVKAKVAVQKITQASEGVLYAHLGGALNPTDVGNACLDKLREALYGH